MHQATGRKCRKILYLSPVANWMGDRHLSPIKRATGPHFLKSPYSAYIFEILFFLNIKIKKKRVQLGHAAQASSHPAGHERGHSTGQHQAMATFTRVRPRWLHSPVKILCFKSLFLRACICLDQFILFLQIIDGCCLISLGCYACL